MNIKTMLLAVLIVGCSQILYAQQDFKTGYNFLNAKGGTLIFKKLDTATKKYIDFNPSINGNFLRGIILKRTEDGEKDTFYLKLWPVGRMKTDTLNSQKKYIPNSSTINNSKGDNKYMMIVNRYDENGKSKLDIPFSTWQLTEVTIPLRYNPSKRKISSEFLNANISYSYIRGKTRFYESEFVKPRDRYYGFGGFAGLGMTKNSLDEDEVGLLYGANIILSAFNVNFLFAYGFESAIGKNSKTADYIGFGVGFDLFKLSGNKNGIE